MSEEKKQMQMEFHDMKSLIESLGESYLEEPLLEGYREVIFAISRRYKGLEVVRNIDKVNGTKYFTIINHNNGSHIHVQGKKIAHRVCDCFDDLINDRNIVKYNKFYKKGALALMGFNIRTNKYKKIKVT